jgi:Arc/MetJ-type ribon-helix-helix transcriptional regulator
MKDKRKTTWQANLQKAHEARRSSKPLTRITLDIFTEQNDWLEQAAQQAGKSKAELIREAIEDYQRKPAIV